MHLSPKPSVKTQTTQVLKIAAVVGIVGLVVGGVFFLISYLGSPKSSMAEDSKLFVVGAEKSLIISEYGSKGHNGQIRDEYIELHNFSDSAINLSGFSLYYYQDKQSTKSISLSGIIKADSFFVIAIRNGSSSSNKPTSNLHYNFIVPAPGWSMNNKGYLILKYGTSIVDKAGSSSSQFKENENYDRTDFLVAGDNISTQWTKMDADNSTPGILNYSDLPAVSPVSTAGTLVNFGANSNLEPVVSIKSSGTVHPGSTSVQVKRGKSPTASIQMIKRYVDIEPTLQPNNVELTFYYHPSELNGLAETELALYSYYSNEWHYIGGIVDTLNDKITASGVTHFSRWSAGSKKDGNLPITLISFKGEYKNEKVDLQWETASEVNNEYFSIEHSKDGVNYKLVGTQKGAGNSSINIKYRITDDNPFEEMTFYRLRQVDYDGKSESFPAIVVRNNATSNQISVEKYGPNPFVSTINLQINSNIEGLIKVNLYSVQGIIVKSQEVECQTGYNTIQFNDLESLMAGTYYLQISSDSYQSKTIKLVKN